MNTFLYPWKNHPIWMSVASLILAIVLATISAYADPGIPRLVQWNSVCVGALAVEVLNETDYDSVCANRPHEKIVAEYVDYLERPFLSSLVELLYPNYSTIKRLGSVKSILEGAQPGETAEAMRQAGNQLVSFYKITRGFSRKPVELVKLGGLPADLAKAVDDALAQSYQKEKEFKEDPRLETAMAACRANRRTILLLVLAWRYDHVQSTKQFETEVEQAGALMFRLANSDAFKDDEATKTKLIRWSRNEDRRLATLRAMSDNDIATVHQLLKEAIEEAYKHLEEDKK